MKEQFSSMKSPSPQSPGFESDAGDLWEMFHKELRGFARTRLDSDAAVDDVLQVAFLRAHQALQEGRVPDAPRAWLFQIVRNIVKDTYRSKARQASLSNALEAEATEPVDSIGNEQDAFELVARALPKFISSLSAPYDEALRLTELEGLSQAQAADLVGVSLSAMKARVRRGREQVRRALLRCCAFEVDGRGRMTECTPRGPGKPCDSCS